MNKPRIIRSNILKHPAIIWTILKNILIPLDPFIIFTNAPIYIIFEGDTIAGFVSIKHFSAVTELGNLYTYPAMRKKGYAKELLAEIQRKYLTVYLLCKPALADFYSSQGFSVIPKPIGVMKLRKKLFDWLLRPFFGYEIIVMKHTSL